MTSARIQQLLRKQNSATRFYIAASRILKWSISFVSFKAITDDHHWCCSHLTSSVSLF